MWIPLDEESATADLSSEHNLESSTQESALTLTQDDDDQEAMIEVDHAADVAATNDLDDIEKAAIDIVRNSTNRNDSDNTDNDDDIEEDDEEEDNDVNAMARDYDVASSRYCACVKHNKPAHLVAVLFFILLFCASVAAFCVVVQMIVVPYCRVSLFQPSNCSVVSTAEVLEADSHCTCRGNQPKCDSRYTCLLIHVLFMDAQGQPHSAHIADNEVLIGSNCSFYPACKASHAENQEELKEYEDAHGKPQQEYTCLYNPMDPNQVIRQQRFQLHHVVHGLVWSSAFLVATLLSLIFTLLKIRALRQG